MSVSECVCSWRIGARLCVGGVGSTQDNFLSYFDQILHSFSFCSLYFLLLILVQVGTDFMEQTIAILDSAVKSEDREEMHAILAAAVQFFYAMVMHKLG